MPAENVEIVRRIYEQWATGAAPWAGDVLEVYEPEALGLRE